MKQETSMMIKLHKMRSEHGITLIELLAVIAIVAILAAIAIPMYTGYLQRARRADAKTALEQLRAAQEMCRAEKGRYANNASDGNALTMLQTTFSGPGTIAGYYAITMVSTQTTFTGTATPSGVQATDGPLTIDHNGTKLPADKWRK
jgi:type IV pilus assembly protein PilE